jgi:hypothetical protein
MVVKNEQCVSCVLISAVVVLVKCAPSAISQARHSADQVSWKNCFRTPFNKCEWTHSFIYFFRCFSLESSRSLRAKGPISWIVYPKTSPIDGRTAPSPSTPAHGPGFAFYPTTSDPSSPSWILEFNVPSNKQRSPAAAAPNDQQYVTRHLFKMEENANLVSSSSAREVLRVNGRPVADGRQVVGGRGAVDRRRCRHFTGVGLGPGSGEGDVAAVTSCTDGQTVDQISLLFY